MHNIFSWTTIHSILLIWYHIYLSLSFCRSLSAPQKMHDLLQNGTSRYKEEFVEIIRLGKGGFGSVFKVCFLAWGNIVLLGEYFGKQENMSWTWSCWCWMFHPCPIHPNWIDSSEALYDSTRFTWRWSTLPEVKICEIVIHEPSSFLKRGNKLQSICRRHFTTQLDSHGVTSHAKSTSSMTNRQQGKRFVSSWSNRVESTTFSAHLA